MSIGAFGLAFSLIGSFVQASMTAAAAKAEAKARNQQLRADMKTQRVKAMAEENDRVATYHRNISANNVAVAASMGGGRNLSYEQGISVFNKKVLVNDLASIRYNADMEAGRMAHQIKVNNAMAKVESASAWTTALVDGFSTVGSYVSRPGGLLA